jgi:hypothetical protein
MELAEARSGVLPADSATSFKNTTPKTPFPNIRDILKNLNIEFQGAFGNTGPIFQKS